MASMANPITKILFDKRTNAEAYPISETTVEADVITVPEPIRIRFDPTRHSVDLAVAGLVWIHRNDPKPVTKVSIIWETKIVLGLSTYGVVDSVIDRLINGDPSKKDDKVLEEVNPEKVIWEDTTPSMEIRIRKDKQKLMRSMFLDRDE
jgi:hypothetical protein